MVGHAGRFGLMSTKITEGELAILESVTTDTDWNAACAKIKADRGGAFPSDWDERVRAAGVMARFIERYSASTGTNVQVV